MINPNNNFENTPAAELQLTGNCGFNIQQNRVLITIDGISSQRPDSTLSGTLSIELWALRQPYQGGQFEGQVLAGTSIGELWGQHSLNQCQYDLLFNEPATGQWHLVLMLREWNGEAYETRDFANFSVPYVNNWKPTVIHSHPAQSNPDNVINVNFKEAEPVTENKVKVEKSVESKAESKVENKAETKAGSSVEVKVEQKPEQPATRTVEAKQADAKAVEAKPVEAKVEPKPEVKSEAKVTPDAKSPAPAKEVEATKPEQPSPALSPAKKSNKISLNDADVSEIAALAGVSAKLAARIVEERPFETLKDVLRVKGMGDKMLKRIQHFVSV